MAQITEDFVSFETAKLLKEKGFNEKTKSYFTDDGLTGYMFGTGQKSNSELENCFYSRPTLQMTMKWLREEKDVQIEICIVGTDTWESPTKWMYGFRCQTKDVIDRRNADFSSYEKACEVAIKYCLENLI